MHLLWVKVGGLWPLNTGGRVRSFHTIADLARRHQVTVLTTRAPGEEADGLARELAHCEQVVAIPHAPLKRGDPRFPIALARSWLSPHPLDLRKWRVPALAREVRRRLATGRFDLCVADFMFATPNVPLGGPVPVVLFAHNVEHLIWKRLCEAEPSAWQRALLEVEWRKFRRSEAQACTAAASTVAVSHVDAALLAAMCPTARVRTIPTGVDVAYFAPNGHPVQPRRLVFSGSMDWYPNEDAVLHFAGEILPRIRQEVPHVSLTVVGRNPGPRLRAAASAAGIEMTGTVEDVRPFIAEGAVYVVPLRIGGGTRLKIFEALAMGKPVVSTTIGSEGLALTPGVHFEQADDPAEFANAVVALLRNPTRRWNLAHAGRRLVEERYTWPRVAREFENHCLEALSA
jgi:glycosyltransferase involved in cell wall biosynthesis